MVKQQAEIPARTQDENYIKNILTRLMIRAIIDNKIDIFTELSGYSKELRESASPDIEKFKRILAPYVQSFGLKVMH